MENVKEISFSFPYISFHGVDAHQPHADGNRSSGGCGELRKLLKEYFEDLYNIDTLGRGCSPHVWL